MKIKKKDAEGEETEDTALRGFYLASVFDISQTAGDDSQLPTLIKGLQGDDPNNLYHTILNNISEHGIPVTEGKFPVKGWYDPTLKSIGIKDDLAGAQRVKTLIHEYAHHKHLSNSKYDADTKDQRNLGELIAESVAYITCSQLGLDTDAYSFPYIKTWKKTDKDFVKVSKIIQDVAGDILSELEEQQELSEVA